MIILGAFTCDNPLKITATLENSYIHKMCGGPEKLVVGDSVAALSEFFIRDGTVIH